MGKPEPVERLELHLKFLFEHGVNFKERVITLSDDIDEQEFLRIDAALTEMESHGKSTITLRINSEGGCVYDALAIAGRIRKSKAHIVTEGYGCVMSAATIILAAGKTRKMSAIAWYMYHEASYEVEGRHSAVKAFVKQAEREEKKWAETMARFSDMDEEFWREKGIAIDAYFTPEQLMEYGAIDEIIPA